MTSPAPKKARSCEWPSQEGLLFAAPRIKTPSEQRLEWLEGLRRPLTDQESFELQRALHAVYCRNRKVAA